MSLPEGLILQYHDTINYEPSIIDAQGIEWILFPDHDTEDPIEWFATIILGTCAGLGVTSAINENCDEVSVPEFIQGWTGFHESEPDSGFTT